MALKEETRIKGTYLVRDRKQMTFKKKRKFKTTSTGHFMSEQLKISLITNKFV